MLTRREFVQVAAAAAAAPLLPTVALPYQAFFIDDWVYVAARSREEAEAWYTDQFGAPVDEIAPASLHLRFSEGEPGDATARQLSFAQAIAEAVQAGETNAFFLAADGHYCC